MSNILIVAGDYPYPPIHGGRVDIWSRIKLLREMNHKLDLIITTKNIEENCRYNGIIKEYIDNLYIVRRQNRVLDMLSMLPLQVKSRKYLSRVELTNNYDYILLEGDYVAEILKNKNLHYRKIILRSHNNESVYFYNLYKSTNNIIKKAYYYLEYIKFKNFEPKLFKDIKNIMFISFDEKIRYEKKCQKANSIFLPASVNSSIKKQGLKNKNALFIGSLFMDNNREAIIWYLKNIHEKVSSKVDGYRLRIAGNSLGTSLSWLDEYVNKYDNIEVYDTPDTLDKLYSNSSVFINPMIHGAGVKLKTIEAIVNGLPVVSTSIGSEGTGLRNNLDIYITNDINEFADTVSYLLNDMSGRKEEMVESAQKFIMNNYNIKDIIDRYLKSIE